MSSREVRTDPVFSQPFGPFLAAYTKRKGNPVIKQAFSVYPRRIFGLPMKEYSYIMFIIKTF